jgi:hypothetical protein
MNDVDHKDRDDMVRETHFMAKEVLEDSDDDYDDDILTMLIPFHDFLASHGKGPKLDESTIDLISKGGCDGCSNFPDIPPPIFSRNAIFCQFT